jgi:tetratricopeptide (TPR) repeat protein
VAKRLVNSALALLQVTIGEARIEPAWPSRNVWWSHAWPFDERLPRVRPTDAEYDRCLEYLDAALLHNPNDVLAWYLRGYVWQAKGRTDLTLRDFRRMVALELTDRDLRHSRIVALELVQGKLRQSAFGIEQEAILEVSNDWTLRTLRESPAARDETR